MRPGQAALASGLLWTLQEVRRQMESTRWSAPGGAHHVHLRPRCSGSTDLVFTLSTKPRCCEGRQQCAGRTLLCTRTRSSSCSAGRCGSLARGRSRWAARSCRSARLQRGRRYASMSGATLATPALRIAAHLAAACIPQSLPK